MEEGISKSFLINTQSQFLFKNIDTRTTWYKRLAEGQIFTKTIALRYTVLEWDCDCTLLQCIACCCIILHCITMPYILLSSMVLHGIALYVNKMLSSLVYHDLKAKLPFNLTFMKTFPHLTYQPHFLKLSILHWRAITTAVNRECKRYEKSINESVEKLVKVLEKQRMELQHKAGIEGKKELSFQKLNEERLLHVW